MPGPKRVYTYTYRCPQCDHMFTVPSITPPKAFIRNLEDVLVCDNCLSAYRRAWLVAYRFISFK
jgi:hypothetical protein